jgi:inner membrane protein YidH
VAELDVSTKLAFDRTRVAYDRTLMAWIRTATSLISFGFAIFKFFQLELRIVQDGHLVGAREFAILMVGIGLLSLLMGTVEYRQNMQLLRAQNPDLPRSRTGILAGLIFILGILALVLVLLRR